MSSHIKPHIQQFLTHYISKFQETNIDVDSLILFGSHARGTAILSSDIDIAVVMKHPLTSKERGHLRSLGEEIDDMIDTNLFFTTRQALEAPTQTFDTNKYIKEEGIVLWPQ